MKKLDPTKIDWMTPDAIARWSFADESHDPAKWLDCALALRRAASTLRKHAKPHSSRSRRFSFAHAFRAQELMLRGMAVECLLKCIAIARKRLWRKWQARAGYPAWLPSHDLVALAAEASLPLSEADFRICRTLTEYITWRGRYPTPRAYAADAGSLDWLAPSERDLGRLESRVRKLAVEKVSTAEVGLDGCPDS